MPNPPQSTQSARGDGGRDQRVVIDTLRDPLTVACVEADVEAKLRDHQEPCGAYACDPQVIVSYVLDSVVDNL